MLILSLIFSFCSYGHASEAPSLIEIPILHFEPLAYSSTTTPTKAASDLTHALELSEKVFNRVANKCGYTTKIESFHFKDDSPIDLPELVRSKTDLIRPWFIVGPRQSHHY